MHIDLCIELGDRDITPEQLAEKVFEFQKSLAESSVPEIGAFSVEVTPVAKGSEFVAALVVLQTKATAEGVVLWKPKPPRDEAV